MKADKQGIHITIKELEGSQIQNPKNELQEGWNFALQCLINHCTLGEPMTFEDLKKIIEKTSERVENSAHSFTEGSNEWVATPKKKVPLQERLDKISEKIKKFYAVPIHELDLVSAYSLGFEKGSKPTAVAEPVKLYTEDQLREAMLFASSHFSTKASIDKYIKNIKL